jgi:hypothetical protein
LNEQSFTLSWLLLFSLVEVVFHLSLKNNLYLPVLLS